MVYGFIAQGLEEMRMSRLPYSGLAPPGDPPCPITTITYTLTINDVDSTNNIQLQPPTLSMYLY